MDPLLILLTPIPVPQGLEEYMRHVEYLLGNGQTTQQVLHPGSHEWPFSVAVPKSIPSTFKGNFGNIG